MALAFKSIGRVVKSRWNPSGFFALAVLLTLDATLFLVESVKVAERLRAVGKIDILGLHAFIPGVHCAFA